MVHGVVPARCSRTKEYFEIQLEYAGGNVEIARGVKAAPRSRTGGPSEDPARTLDFLGSLLTREGYGCPWCGAGRVGRCGTCSRYGCLAEGEEFYSCPWCGTISRITGTIHTFDVFDDGRSGQKD